MAAGSLAGVVMGGGCVATPIYDRGGGDEEYQRMKVHSLPLPLHLSAPVTTLHCACV